MKILFDLQHPAHLHFFRNVVLKLKNENHDVSITGRDKDILVELGQNYAIDVKLFGVARKGLLNLGLELIYRQWRLRQIIKKVKPDVMIAIAGTYLSLLGKLMRIPTYVFYDTEHAALSNLISYPFATCVYVPNCYLKEIHWNHVRYNGYHEIAYLHPKYFKPNVKVLHDMGLKEGTSISLVRFVSWEAAHDAGLKGLSIENKRRLVKALSKFGKVFISSEGELPPELKPYQLNLDVHKIHDFLAYTSLFFGESATMASEAAILGVPAIYVNPLPLGYLREQERDYQIVFNYTPEQQDEAIQKAVSILSNYHRNYWRNIGEKILEDKIDVTDMLYKIIVEKGFSNRRGK